MRRTLVSIDVGTTKVCTIVAQAHDEHRLNVLGVGLTQSKGVDKGVIVNIDDAVSAIATSIEKAERLSGYRIDTAYVGVAGRHVASLNSRGVVAVSHPEQEITPYDVGRAVEAAQAIAIPTQREVVHIIPRAYIVDGHEGIRDPVGMSGFRLEVETHIVTGEVMAIQNLIKSVQRAGVEIDDLILQPLASGEAVLTPEDKDRGVVLVDIGGTTTDVALFVQGGIWHTSVIPVGGAHFTNDIVYVLHTPHNTAEYLKLKYGTAIADADAVHDDDLIDADTLVVGERQQISRQLLGEILQARAEQMVELIYEEIQRSGYDGLLQSGIVITGGAAQLPRFDELMRDMLGMPVRIGKPTGLSGLAESTDTPPYATSVGLLYWGLRHGQSESPYRGAGQNGWGRASIYDRLKNWLREFLP
ncbi:MAG: cell division protein FtsA [Chloroflexaceae bacterium]|nr:cell division protein FtsA [Chloroflexaceae bacterium]NJO04349.1 cell division protein FtsA [Chloroflexaceae bacterium]